MGGGAADAPVTSGWTLPSLCLSLPVCGMGDQTLDTMKMRSFHLSNPLTFCYNPRDCRTGMETGGLHRKGDFQGTPRSLGAWQEGKWGSRGRLASHVSAAMTSMGPVSLKGPPASSHNLIYLVYRISDCTESSERQSSLQTIYQREKDRGPGGRQAAPRPREPQPLAPARPGLPARQCLVRAWGLPGTSLGLHSGSH